METLVFFLILGGMFSVFIIENNVCYRFIIYGQNFIYFFFEMAKILKELYIDVRQTFTKIQFFSGYIITFV